MIFERGDIVFVEFSPTNGHEQAGGRPALVIQNSDYSRVIDSCYIVLPISSTSHLFPLDVALDERTATRGHVLCRQIRAVDLKRRNARFVEKAPEDIVENCVNNVISLISSL